MDISNAFAAPELEQDGVWIDYRDDSRIKIARLGNPVWQRRYDAAMKPFRRLERDGKLAADKQTEIICRSYAQAILLDWQSFESDGKPYPYSEDNAYRLLLAHIDFRNEVTELAAMEDHFKRALVADSAKNSSTSSPGA